MGKKLVATGRGGTGKSTFTSLTSRYLPPPIFLIDLDPDQSLAEMLGVNLKEEGVKTISEALYDIIAARKAGAGGSMSVHERIQFLLNTEALYEGNNFDLFVLGTKLTEGCYCAPDAIISGAIPKIIDSYRYVMIDSPAGLEHLNREVVSDIDDLFVILDPSSKSLKHIERIKNITSAIGIKYNHFYLVGNYRFDKDTQKKMEATGEIYLGNIEYDPDLEKYNLSGRSLLDLPEDSPACKSVKKILTKAGLL
ncbi:MAG: AAA family ATPase [Deltaproteobacteria bacterium]|nr:AAA family ATPase [Deltaproteobacteria bacterium]